MPRRNLARRFEPRYGVSQLMLDTESKYVGRELDDLLIHSKSELKEKLGAWQKQIATAEEELLARLNALPDRQRLALRCIFARDCWYMAMLYLCFLGSASMPDLPRPDTAGSKAAVPEEIDERGGSVPVIAFKDSLFE
jgi:hypothetical protein